MIPQDPKPETCKLSMEHLVPIIPGKDERESFYKSAGLYTFEGEGCLKASTSRFRLPKPLAPQRIYLDMPFEPPAKTEIPILKFA